MGLRVALIRRLIIYSIQSPRLTICWRYRREEEIEQPVPMTAEETCKEKEAEPEKVIISEDLVKKNIPPPFPQALRSKKKIPNQVEIWEVLRQVKVNIPLLDMIKQVPTYAKFLKDMCTVKKGLGIEKKAFITEKVSAIIQSKTLVKFKDPGSPTISVNIVGTCIDKSLLDLGASVNLLPYSVYKQLGLGELKPTNITFSLADRSVKIPKGIFEDVLVKVDKFYYPVDFVVLDTEPIASGSNHVPIILGRPFLATANAIINCRNGVMQLTFDNMTLELNILHLSNKHKLVEDDKQGADEVCLIGQNVGKPKAPKLQAELVSQDEAVEWELSSSITPAEPMVSPKSPSEKKFNKKEPSMRAVAQATAGVKELLLLDPS